MRRPLLLLALAAAASPGVGLPAEARSAARAPVVVELYTAQGCASCPEADKLLQGYAARRGVVALTLPVDYWDYLGWADTFAKPAFTERQRAYATRLKVREIYTPEVIVDGRREAAGADAAAVDALVAAEAHGRAPDGLHVELLAGAARVKVSPGRGAPGRADVWLVRFDPTLRSVKIKTGDNKGKTVVQKNVVSELTRLGGYAGGVRRYTLPKAGGEGLSTLVLVQGAKGGRIMGASAPSS